MLKGINPILSPYLLHCLRSMGHGDEIAIVDGNYPALEHARRLIRLDGIMLIPAIDAILSILPIDDFTASALFRSTNGDIIEPVHDRNNPTLRTPRARIQGDPALWRCLLPTCKVRLYSRRHQRTPALCQYGHSQRRYLSLKRSL